MNTIYKKTIHTFVLLLSAWAMLTGCKDDEFKDVSVTAVGQFYEPADNRHVILNGNGNMYFEWEKALAADNSVVYYDVLFAKEDGDFSNPVYSVPADNKGLSTGASIPHTTLNRIAMLAGIELAEVGTLKWTVRSSRGLKFTLPEQARTLTLVRLNSIDNLEGGEMFITGEGSEAEQPFKLIELSDNNGSEAYEIFTRLEAGKNYYFHATLGATERLFTVNSDNTTFRETLETPDGTTVSETGVYRIFLNFAGATASVQKIDKAEIVVSWTQRKTAFTYVSRGTWELKDYNVQLASTSWGFDERYKIVFTYGETEQHWGQEGPHFDDRPALNRAGYRDMKVTDGGQWGGSQFKFPNELCDGNDLDKYTTDVTITMAADKNYTHDFTNIRQ